MATKKKYIAHFEDISYYDGYQEARDFFGKEYSTPIFSSKRKLRKFLLDLNTLGMCSYTYHELRVN